MSHKQEEVVEYKRCELLTQSRTHIIDTGKTSMSPAAVKSQQGNNNKIHALKLKWVVPSIINSFPAALAILERTSFTVTNENVETITFRSTECLRLRSIKATYENAIARCETSNKTIFEIHLFRGEGEGEKMSVVEQKEASSVTNEEGSTTILVEIQLRSGDCMEFQDEYIALREAILNNNLPKVKTEEELMKEEERDPEEELKVILKDKYIPISEDVIERNVQRVAKNMTSSSSSSSSIADILFSLKEVRSLTKVPSSSRRTALKASKMIMMEDEFSNIKQKIMQTITSTPNEDAEEIHSLALTILVNCLKALHRSNDVNSSGVFQNLGKSVVPTLVKILNHSEDEPHLACLAAECISILMKSIRQEGMEISTIKNALVHGKDVGMESYYNLERTTTKALQTLSPI